MPTQSPFRRSLLGGIIAKAKIRLRYSFNVFFCTGRFIAPGARNEDSLYFLLPLRSHLPINPLILDLSTIGSRPSATCFPAYFISQHFNLL